MTMCALPKLFHELWIDTPQLAPYTICMLLIKIQYMSDDVEDTNYMTQHREFLCIAT